MFFSFQVVYAFLFPLTNNFFSFLNSKWYLTWDLCAVFMVFLKLLDTFVHEAGIIIWLLKFTLDLGWFLRSCVFLHSVFLGLDTPFKIFDAWFKFEDLRLWLSCGAYLTWKTLFVIDGKIWWRYLTCSWNTWISQNLVLYTWLTCFLLQECYLFWLKSLWAPLILLQFLNNWVLGLDQCSVAYLDFFLYLWWTRATIEFWSKLDFYLTFFFFINIWWIFYHFRLWRFESCF